MTNPDKAHWLLISDRSGSMGGIARDMEGGIAQMLSDQKAAPGEATFEHVDFDNEIVQRIPPTNIQDVDSISIVPRGSTALLDAIGKSVTATGEYLASLPEDERPGKVLVTIVTDGHENSSKEWTNETVKALITEQQEKYGWVFSYLGANQDAFAVAGKWGVAKGATMTYTASAAGTRGMTKSVSAATTAFRSGGTYNLVDSQDSV